jgi:hypothetical protein
MKKGFFTLRYKIQSSDLFPENYIDRLYEIGCDEGLIGIGLKIVLLSLVINHVN